MTANSRYIASCEIEVTVRLIGGKYKTLILYQLQRKSCRFSELHHAMPGLSQKTLTAQLRELEEDGLINRTVSQQKPLRVDYALTEKGASLGPLLELMCQWGEAHSEGFTITHQQCFDE